MPPLLDLPHNILFWNIQGFSNIYQIDNSCKHLLSYSIALCILETWLSSNIEEPPQFIKNHKIIQCMAVKEKCKGRARGGLILFLHPCIDQFEIINSSSHWIVVKMKIKLETLIIGLLYLKPDLDTEETFENLKFLINETSAKFPYLPIIYGEDWNSHIGEMNQSTKEVFDGSNLNEHRKTMKLKTNKKGKLLMEIMEMNNCYVLNGRSCSDTPAHYTFINTLGQSIIDLIWANYVAISLIKDFKIIRHTEHSDRLICTVTLPSTELVNRKLGIYSITTYTIRELYKCDKDKQHSSMNSSKAIYYHSENKMIYLLT